MSKFPVSRFLDYLDRLSVGRSSKYLALRQSIVGMVEDGYLAAGERLPPEQELTNLSGFSLGTVQKALTALSNEGYVVRKHGHGTFISEMGNRLHDPLHLRFLGDDGKSFLPIYTSVLSVDRVDDSGPWSDIFGGETKEFVRIRRLIDVGREFRCLNQFYGAASLFERFAREKNLDGLNLKKFIASHVGIETNSAANLVRAGPLSGAGR